jgi:hypothetical protein
MTGLIRRTELEIRDEGCEVKQGALKHKFISGIMIEGCFNEMADL